MGQKSLDKKKAKEMQRAINQLQNELGEEIIAVFKEAGRALDLAELMEIYPENERKTKNDAKTFKSYLQLGIGPLVHNGQLKQLPVSSDGKYRLELVEN